ncbi:MAG: hypothetical protein JHC40_09250 [Burkholderiales bacterium]|nr:hypothetical protein [Burkholderiales bacterium]
MPLASGDSTSGYSIHVQVGRPLYEMNVGGERHLLRLERPVAPGKHRLGLRSRLGPRVGLQHLPMA